MAENPVPSRLSQEQILQRAFSEETDRLRIDTTITSALTERVLVTEYAEITSVASGVLSTMVTKVISIGSKLRQVEISGTNFAEYTVELNNVIIAKTRTSSYSGLNYLFEFCEPGLPLQAGDVIRTKVIHSRPDVGDFAGRISILEG